MSYKKIYKEVYANPYKEAYKNPYELEETSGGSTGGGTTPTLDEAKKAAKKELTEYSASKEPLVNPTGAGLLEPANIAANAEIDKATTNDEVATSLAKGKAAIDKIVTDNPKTA